MVAARVEIGSGMSFRWPPKSRFLTVRREVVMPCYSKRRAWLNVNGGRPVFHEDDPRCGEEIFLPCGQCIGCRAGRKKDWGLRSEHEASLYADNSFITLTYTNDNLPVGNVLYPRHMQLFFKRLRRAIEPLKIRYLMCGEYGETTGRAHYHANIFGWFPADAVEYPSSGDQLFTSEMLTRLWGLGDVKVMYAGPGTGHYVAGHNVSKALALAKVNGEAWRLDGAHCKLLPGRALPLLDAEGKPVVWIPEFVRVSNRPGLGLGWLQRYPWAAFNEDGCITNEGGVKQRVPRFYVDALERGRIDDEYGNFDSCFAEAFKQERRERARSLNPADETPRRLKDRAQCAIARVKFLAKPKKL